MAKALTEPDKATQALVKVQSFELTNNDHTKHLAGVVATFIDEKKLFTNIQGKKYVNVEGWLYAGSQLGILPVVVKVEDVSRTYEEAGTTKMEVRYRAEAKLVNIHNQQEVGYGVAMCSNKEVKKKYFDEYAIMSMAETRAVGKAYRLMIGWLMSAAGYSPTPYEEMENVIVDTVTESKPVKPITPEPAKPTLPDGLLSTIEGAVSREELLEIWDGNRHLQTNPDFTAAITRAKDKMPEIHPLQNPHAVPVDLKTSILLLLGDENSVFSKEEKEKFIAAIKRRDSETEPGKAKLWAETVITKLKSQIKERSTQAA